MNENWQEALQEFSKQSTPHKLLLKYLIEELLKEIKYISSLNELENWYNIKGKETYYSLAQKIAPHIANQWIWELILPLDCACALQYTKITEAQSIANSKNKEITIELD